MTIRRGQAKSYQQTSEADGHWVYTLKQGMTPDQVEYKARYVAKGYSQAHGDGYDETFWPLQGLPLSECSCRRQQMDSCNYINWMWREPTWMLQLINKSFYNSLPATAVERNSCLLQNSIYGLKQSGHNWHQKLTNCLKSESFTANEVTAASTPKMISTVPSPFFSE
jgi:Reverse transcriptase (RNA-dependent DNA polymerase).